MRCLVLIVFLPLLLMSEGLAQQFQRGEPKYDIKRCNPKRISHKPVSKPNIHVRKGEKSTGYSPVIAWEVLESGEVVNTRIKRSSGIADQDAYALSTINGSKFNTRPGCGTVETEAVGLIHWVGQ